MADVDDIDYSNPFTTRIIKDCRDKNKYGPSGNLDGHYGTCLGEYNYPNIWEKAPEPNMGGLDYVPLILADCGDYIWGIECWRDPNPEENKDFSLEMQQSLLELHIAKINRDLGREEAILN